MDATCRTISHVGFDPGCISPPAVDSFLSMCAGPTGALSSALFLSFSTAHISSPSLHLDLVCSMAPLPSLSFCSMRPERVVGGLAAGGRAAGLACRQREALRGRRREGRREPRRGWRHERRPDPRRGRRREARLRRRERREARPLATSAAPCPDPVFFCSLHTIFFLKNNSLVFFMYIFCFFHLINFSLSKFFS